MLDTGLRPSTLYSSPTSIFFAYITSMNAIDNIIHLGEGTNLTPGELEDILVHLGYRKTDEALARGYFRRSRHNIEIFMPNNSDQKGVRIEFYNHAVESIYSINPLSGRSVARSSDLLLSPISLSIHAGKLNDDDESQNIYKI